MNITSKLREVGPCYIPQPQASGIVDWYDTIPFYQSTGLPEKYDRWQMTVDDMLSGINTNLKCFFRVSEMTVNKGQLRFGQQEPAFFGCFKQTEPVYANSDISQSGYFQVYGDIAPMTCLWATSMPVQKAAVGEYSCTVGAGGLVTIYNPEQVHWVGMSGGKAYAMNETGISQAMPAPNAGLRVVVNVFIPFLPFDQ